MPDPALPQPWPEALPGRVAYRRVYRDALGRPMTGTATLTGKRGGRVGAIVVPPVTVTVQIVGGLLHVDLLPDHYTLTAALRTADGAKVTDRDEFTVEAS